MTAAESGLSIVHKGLLLSLLPLIVQFVLIANLSLLLRQADRDNRLARETGKVIEQEHTLLELILTTATAAEHCSISGESLFPGQYKEQSSQLKEILTAAPTDELELEQVKTLKVHKEQAAKLLQMIEQEASAATRDRTSLSQEYGKGLLSAALRKYESDLQNYLKDEEPRRIALQKTQIRSRRELNIFIFAAVAIDLILAVILSSVFVLGISRRLTLLNDNIQRFSSGMELWSPREGSDELSRLDYVFHDMAHSLMDARDKLLASEARLQMLIQTLPIGLLIIKDGGSVEAVNETFSRTFGYSTQTLKGASVEAILPDLDWISLFSDESKEKGDTEILETTARNQDSQTVPVELTLKKLNMPEGTRLLVAVQDISKRHETERLKQEFVAMVTHDLRTPLTSIHLFHQLLRKSAFGNLPESVQQPLQSAELSTDRLLCLVNELLDYEKLVAGKLQLRFAATRLSVIIERSIEAVNTFATEHELTITGPNFDIEVMVDEQRIIQVMVNLLSNAIKFSKAGSRIEILSTLQNDSEYLEISVVDHGKGIPHDKQSLVFERYKQANMSDQELEHGTGLGLTISKGIVEEHRGTIGVVSEPGKGSCFWFRLPVGLKKSGMLECE